MSSVDWDLIHRHLKTDYGRNRRCKVAKESADYWLALLGLVA